MAREFVNRIQNLRKDSGFEVTDKIYITIQEGPLVWKESINEFKSYISQEVQALDIEWKNQLEGATEVNMEDVNLFVQIRK